MKKGLLDICVLHILKKEDAYGYKITQEVTKLLNTSESALYPVLRRHEKQGCLETYSVEISGRLRKYYRITKNGNIKFRENIKELKDMKKIIDYLTGGDDIG
jgi:PadR family transcriptional regulator PadR